MSRDLKDDTGVGASVSKHPPAATIEDVITFQLHILVAIGERAGQHWSERMFDLSLNEWRCLALVKARAPCRASDLADLLLMDKSQTSRVIKSLHQKDLIENMADPADGRAIALKTTQKGDALYKSVFAEVMSSNERILAPLCVDEVQAFEKTLKKF